MPSVASVARVAAALVLALVASELGLRVLGIPRKHDRLHSCDNEMSVADERLGWVWRAESSRDVRQGGRLVHFAFDGHGDRARDEHFVEDPDAPTVLFVGESIIAGHGLEWPETLPALVGAALSVQVVDLGVDGYGSDLAFVRLHDTLPRLHHVLAVVTMFFPALVERVSWADRPRVSLEGSELVVRPPHVGVFEDMRLTRLARELAPLDASAIALTGRLFVETARLAGTRGARALFLAPEFPGGWPRGSAPLAAKLLASPGLEVIAPAWDFHSLPDDNHPDAASVARLAQAVVEALRGPVNGQRNSIE